MVSGSTLTALRQLSRVIIKQDWWLSSDACRLTELKNLRSEAGILCMRCSSSQQYDPCRTSSSIAMSSMTLSLTYPSFVRTNRHRSAAEIGKAFVNHYYSTFPHATRANLQTLFNDSSLLTWEGNPSQQFMGMTNIMTHLVVRGRATDRPRRPSLLRTHHRRAQGDHLLN